MAAVKRAPRRKVEPPSPWGGNRRAVEAAVARLGSDVLEGDLLPLVEATRELASLLDVDPVRMDVWHQYRMFLRDLREAAAGGGSDELDALIEGLRASVGDGENPDT